ncbi:MAG TPA: hypothetical protein VN609_09205 [Propionibacteriaceae bacterium]|nr:hypothetical protein [Propionibacteriaceae bacterium]
MTDRFEPIPRDDDVNSGLAARVHDPLWLLCRQWQFGEFRGEDAGSIAMVNAQVATHRLDRWRAGETDWRDYDPRAQPLERLVEQEPADAAQDSKLRTAGGIRLARLLTAARIATGPWVQRYGFAEPDDERVARGLSALIRARIGDGAKIATGLRRLSDPPTADDEATRLGLTPDQRAAAAGLATEWLRWWDSRAASTAELGVALDQQPAAWDDRRLEHAFSVRATGLASMDLRAAEYDGGSLDWWSLDAGEPIDDANPAANPVRLALRGIPAPATFGGMPTARFWEMEDARIDFGSVDAAPHDLARLMMLSYATVYGNDWYVVPVRMPIGTLCRVETLTVRDVFGGEQTIGPVGADSQEFHLFSLTDVREPNGASPWFLLAPAMPGSLESPAIESVLVARDEMANLAWAIEQRIEDAAGASFDRYDAMRRPARPEPSAMPAYHVDSSVPEFWFPVAPEQLEDRESVRLRLIPLTRREAAPPDGVTKVLPLGVILAGARTAAGFWLHEEEVPRSGIGVTRSHQRARWHDGSVHTWTTRRKSSGGGESSSGLRFDTVDKPGSGENP